MLYNPMSHGAHTLLYNPMTHGAHALLYNPVTHGDLYPLYNVVWSHDPWGFVTIAAPMTHGKKVAEPCGSRASGGTHGGLFNFVRLASSEQLRKTMFI